MGLEDKGRNPLAHQVYSLPFGLTKQSPGLLAGWESLPVRFRIFWCKTFSFIEPGIHFEYDVWQCEIENTFGAKDDMLVKRSWILSLLVVSQSVSCSPKLQRQLLKLWLQRYKTEVLLSTKRCMNKSWEQPCASYSSENCHINSLHSPPLSRTENPLVRYGDSGPLWLSSSPQVDREGLWQSRMRKEMVGSGKKILVAKQCGTRMGLPC